MVKDRYVNPAMVHPFSVWWYVNGKGVISQCSISDSKYHESDYPMKSYAALSIVNHKTRVKVGSAIIYPNGKLCIPNSRIFPYNERDKAINKSEKIKSKINESFRK